MRVASLLVELIAMDVRDLAKKKMDAKVLTRVVDIAKPYMNAIRKEDMIIVTSVLNFPVADLKNLQKHGKNMVRI